MISSIIYHLHGKRWAETLAPNDYHDIIELWKHRIVSVSAKGKSISEIYADIRSHWHRELKIVIPHGTVFRARGGHQNMASREERVLEIAPGKTRFLQIAASCVDAEREIPGNRDTFYGVRRVSTPLQRFMKAADGYSSTVVQAGVWSLSNNYGRREIRERLVTLSNNGGSGSAISDRDMDTAARVLASLDIESPLRAA